MRRRIVLRSFDRMRVAHSVPGKRSFKTLYLAKFETHDFNKRRHELRAYVKSRAGAWQAAVRWHKKLEKGIL